MGVTGAGRVKRSQNRERDKGARLDRGVPLWVCVLKALLTFVRLKWQISKAHITLCPATKLSGVTSTPCGIGAVDIQCTYIKTWYIHRQRIDYCDMVCCYDMSAPYWMDLDWPVNTSRCILTILYNYTVYCICNILTNGIFNGSFIIIYRFIFNFAWIVFLVPLNPALFFTFSRLFCIPWLFSPQ